MGQQRTWESSSSATVGQGSGRRATAAAVSTRLTARTAALALATLLLLAGLQTSAKAYDRVGDDGSWGDWGVEQAEIDGDLTEGTRDMGSMREVARVVGAPDVWRHGVTGKGVGVALIDSGVLPVEGLTGQGKVINGPDLSFESQADELRYLDTFGHGTHMAGIIAGHDGTAGGSDADDNRFVGMAPGAHLVSLKLASADGATDVSQVIAAVDWVVEHRNDPGLNIRVLNLSYGTDGTQSYLSDPLSHAIEVAWRHGIVVVVSAGNNGADAALNNPALDPYALAVGGADLHGTRWTDDDTIAEFSSRGDGSRQPDLLAPSRSIASLRATGSYIDDRYPDARVGDRLMRGSGTSQAAAVVSGAVALLLEEQPRLTPDQVKRVLIDDARRLPSAAAFGSGAGLLDVDAAYDTVEGRPRTRGSRQTWAISTGLGSLELARGTQHVSDDGVELTGERDVFGRAWDAATWARNAEAETAWVGGWWNGLELSGSDWSGSSWAGKTWAGKTWAGDHWVGKTWAGNTWTGKTWAGNAWTGKAWASSP